jgi:Putative peptidoglycan binding domain
MSDPPTGKVVFASENGIFGTFPDFGDALAKVGPATADQSNRLRTPLIPKACWKLEESNFEFDSSFVLPLGLTLDTGRLKQLLDAHPKSVLSVFGHADPVGRDEYNKTLSGRRALAVYALLIRRSDIWDDLYRKHDTSGRDKWGLRSIQIMLNQVLPLGRAAELGGSIDGTMDEPTRQKLREFQTAQGLPQTPFGPPPEHIVDKATFAALAAAYMDKVCTDDDGTPFQVAKTDFLARGEDNNLKGDVQGCSEFNPLLIFSQAKQRQFDDPSKHKVRNEANKPNRRVMVLLFRAGSRVDPNRWPCPRAKEDTNGCRKRFFSDFRKRLANGPEDREFEKTKDTFACRFYDRLVSSSPCEIIVVPAFATWEVPPINIVPGTNEGLPPGVEIERGLNSIPADDPRAADFR